MQVTPVARGAAARVGCGQGADDTVGDARSVQPGPPPVRLSMAALHATGGVPVDWKLLPPPGDVARGRRLFAQYGCPSCHVVQGETFAEQRRSPGPELTGMGAHHPPGYFVEAILNPDAIVVDGDGYTGERTSTMPTYPDMPPRSHRPRGVPGCSSPARSRGVMARRPA
jgi:hypothetical protein